MFGIEFLELSFGAAIVIAGAAGLLSFLSPCVLPVALPYLAYIGGISVRDMDGETGARRRALHMAIFFVLGLSTVFLLLGYGFAALGRMFPQAQDWFIMGAGVLVIGFGLHFLGVYRIKFLDQEARMDAGDRGGTAFGAYILGLAFAFGWTPCLGPILSGILTIAVDFGETGKGLLLLAVYAAGLGIPFLLLAAFFPRLKGLMNWMKRHLNAVEKTSGVLLIIVGLLMVTGRFTMISNWLLNTFPSLGLIG